MDRGDAFGTVHSNKAYRIPSSEEALAFCSPCATTRDRPSQPGQPSVIIIMSGDLINVLGARLDRDRDGLLVFFVGVVLLRVAAAVYFLTHLLVAAGPVVMSKQSSSVIGVSRLPVPGQRL